MFTWAKPGTWSVTGASILISVRKIFSCEWHETRRTYEWGTDESNIERDVLFSRQALNPWKPGEGRNTRENCVGRY